MGSTSAQNLALAFALALAGCFGSGAQPATEAVPTTEATTPPVNKPPQFSFEADPLSGEVPLEVTFTIDGFDPDGHNLTWFIDVDDDHASEDSGKALPATYTYTFHDIAEYRVRVTVTDGEFFVEDALHVNAHAPTIEDHPIEPVVFEGTITGAWAGDYMPGPDVHAFRVPAVPNEIRATIEVGPTAVDLDYVLRTPNGDWADGRADPNEPTGLAFSNKEPDLMVTDESKLHQLGDWSLEVWAGASVEGTYRVTIEFA